MPPSAEAFTGLGQLGSGVFGALGGLHITKDVLRIAGRSLVAIAWRVDVVPSGQSLVYIKNSHFGQSSTYSKNAHKLSLSSH